MNVHMYPRRPRGRSAISTGVPHWKFTVMRFLTITGFAAVLATGIAGPGRVQAAGPHAAGSAACAIRYIYGSEVCYAPAQVLQAERKAPFAVHPSAAVARLFRLSLAQVIIHLPASGSRRADSISYLYGVLRSDYGRGPANPRSMVITEYAVPYTRFVPSYTRIVGGARFEISQAALDHPYHPWGPWYVIGNFAHHNHSFTITANVPQGQLLELASALRRQG